MTFYSKIIKNNLIAYPFNKTENTHPKQITYCFLRISEALTQVKVNSDEF